MPTGDDVELRALRADEGRSLQRFYNGLSRESHRLFHPLGWNACLSECERIAREAAAGRRFDVVAVCGGAIVGWAFLSPIDPDVPVLGIAVADDFQGRGLGARLMHTLVDEGNRRGLKGIALTVVHDNDRARSLYERFGFCVTGGHRGADGLDYLEMEMRYSGGEP
ncbi:MAG: GNAT family N-acetyltransferase [Armatimonadota bacterium]